MHSAILRSLQPSFPQDDAMLLEIPGATIESHPCTLSNLPGKLRLISQLLEFRSLE